MKSIFLIVIVIISFSPTLCSQQNFYWKINWKFTDNHNESISNLDVQFGCPGYPTALYFKTNSNGLISTILPMQTIQKDSMQVDTICGCVVQIFDDRYESFHLGLFEYPKQIIENGTELIKLNLMTSAQLDKKKFAYLSGRISKTDIALKDTIIIYDFAKINPYNEPYSMDLSKDSKNNYKLVFYEKPTAFDNITQIEKTAKIKLKKKSVTIKLDGKKNKFILSTFKSNNEYRYILTRE